MDKMSEFSIKYTKECIEVMQAYVNGEPIESFSVWGNEGAWRDDPSPNWDWTTHNYRVKESINPIDDTKREEIDLRECIDNLIKRIDNLEKRLDYTPIQQPVAPYPGYPPYQPYVLIEPTPAYPPTDLVYHHINDAHY